MNEFHQYTKRYDLLLFILTTGVREPSGVGVLAAMLCGCERFLEPSRRGRPSPNPEINLMSLVLEEIDESSRPCLIGGCTAR
jgi:hypothetical protein